MVLAQLAFIYLTSLELARVSSRLFSGFESFLALTEIQTLLKCPDSMLDGARRIEALLLQVGVLCVNSLEILPFPGLWFPFSLRLRVVFLFVFFCVFFVVFVCFVLLAKVCSLSFHWYLVRENSFSLKREKVKEMNLCGSSKSCDL